jgi:hypothetical protein
MATGWAYVDCTTSGTGGGQAAGPTGSVQFLTGTNSTSGSANLLYHTASSSGYAASTMILTGTLIVEGSVSASHYHIEDVAIIDATGSTFFGNTNDDTHMRTGSLVVTTVGPGAPITILSASTTTQATHIRGLNVLYEFVPVNYGTAASVAMYTASAPSYIIGVRSTGSVSIQIPSAATYKSGAILLIKDEVGHTNGTDITITGALASILIDNARSYSLTGSNPAISLYSNGTNWFVF